MKLASPRAFSGTMHKHLTLAAAALMASGCSHSGITLGEHPFLVAERTVWCGSSLSLSFYPDGRVEQVTDESCTRAHESHRAYWLVREDLEALQSRVTQARFFTLPERLEDAATTGDEDRLRIDAGDTLSLTAWSHGKSHSVAAQGLARISPSPEAQRFLLVWSAVQAISGTERAPFDPLGPLPEPMRP
jgi:hypothetical protein